MRSAMFGAIEVGAAPRASRARSHAWILVGALALFGCTPMMMPPVGASTPVVSFDTTAFPKLAVVMQGDRGYTDGVLRTVEDVFFKELLAKRYIIAARSDLKSVMQEMTLQQSAVTDTDAARLGKALNVPAVLIVSITDLQASAGKVSSATIGARLVSVERAEVLWVDTASGSAATNSPSATNVLNNTLGPLGTVLGSAMNRGVSLSSLATSLSRRFPPYGMRPEQTAL